MEKSESVCCLLVGVLLMFCCTSNAQDDAALKQVIDDATRHPNLSPFEGWISAYKCLLNVSTICPDKFILTEYGNLGVIQNATQNDTKDYCENGCAEHTRGLLWCISLVKRDYKFRNNATVHDLNNTINTGCSSGFTGEILRSNSMRVYVNIFTTFISAFIMAWFLISNS